MTALEGASTSVRTWFHTPFDDASAPGILGEILTPTVIFDFVEHSVEGRQAVIEHLQCMPLRLADVEWQLLPGATATEETVRVTGPGGAPLPSPGGPLLALDFEFGLDDRGRISVICPRPHHEEPDDLDHAEPDDLATPLTSGQLAPDFTLPDTDGTAVSLHEGSAPATVVVFTSNACPWALGWHQRLQRVATDYAGAGIRFLQINANDPERSPRDCLENSQRRVTEGAFAGPYLLDDGQRVARQWGATRTPDVFVLHADGMVAYHGAPDADAFDETHDARWLRAVLDHMLTGSPAFADTAPVGCPIKWTL